MFLHLSKFLIVTVVMSVGPTTNPPFKDEPISSFGLLFQMFQLLVQSLVLSIVPFVLPPLFFPSRQHHRAVMA